MAKTSSQWRIQCSFKTNFHKKSDQDFSKTIYNAIDGVGLVKMARIAHVGSIYNEKKKK